VTSTAPASHDTIRAVLWQGDHLRLLDQRRLPFEETYIDCLSAGDVAAAIRGAVPGPHPGPAVHRSVRRRPGADDPRHATDPVRRTGRRSATADQERHAARSTGRQRVTAPIA